MLKGCFFGVKIKKPREGVAFSTNVNSLVTKYYIKIVVIEKKS